MGKFVRNVVAGKELPIHGDGASSRDFVAVEDVANIVLHFIRRPAEEIVNIATGTSHTILDLVAIIGETVGKTPRTSRIPESDPSTTLEFDVTRLRHLCPNVQMTSLDRGVQDYAIAATHGQLDELLIDGNTAM